MKIQAQSNMESKLRGNGSASSISIFAEQAFWRAAGARLIPGNSARILKDAAENYPAWLEAIESARHTIHFESYVIHEDEQGRLFADALIDKARDGVRVRLIYDWMGAFNSTSNGFWRRLRQAGIEARCFNPPRLDSPFGWLGRDHRKMLSVDGRVGFVSGLCVGRMWVGDERRGVEPWRDTGIEIRGPAVAELELAFAQMWATCGQPIPSGEFSDSMAPIRHIPPIREHGDVALRIVASMPYSAGLYRLDRMIAAAARETLWLTDAYFAGTTPYIQALSAASRDGVDVRLLVPQATDIPVVRALSRTGYRPLLESGVRVYDRNLVHRAAAPGAQIDQRIHTQRRQDSGAADYARRFQRMDSRPGHAIVERAFSDWRHTITPEAFAHLPRSFALHASRSHLLQRNAGIGTCRIASQPRGAARFRSSAHLRRFPFSDCVVSR